MSRQAEEHIPADVLYAAKRAGLKTPLWYAGRSNGHEGKKLEQSLDEMLEAPYRDSGRKVPEIRRKSSGGTPDRP